MGEPRHEESGAARLKSPRDFKAVYQAGRSVAGKYIVLYYVKAVGDRAVGFTSARAVPTAVARNRVRRVLRAAWRSVEEEVASGARIVLVGRPRAGEAGSDKVARELAALLAKAGLRGSSGVRSRSQGTHGDADR